MTRSVPCSAAGAPPLTGASSTETPRRCADSATSRQVSGCTVLWMATARAVERHVVPIVTAGAREAGKAAPRVVAGLPVAVHDDVAEARAAAVTYSTAYAGMANYRRILEIGGAATPAEAAIVGDETAVGAQLRSLVDAGATDVWAAPFPVGDDPKASLGRTRSLLMDLARA